ncbi:hypothetical protein ACFX2L_24060, partial [Escherichia coli]|uniref:hypothetical protein n=1 Tax=Escherichia coli TaxID=562 RepID=UPI00368BB4A6
QSQCVRCYATAFIEIPFDGNITVHTPSNKSGRLKTTERRDDIENHLLTLITSLSSHERTRTKT